MADPVTIDSIREKYPQYNDMSDAQLADGLHQKFYADMPFNQFAAKIGYSYDAQGKTTPYSPDSIPAPMAEMPRGQSQVAADINAPLQGLVGGVGAGIAGAGRAAQAAGIQGTKAQLAVMDAIDRGDKVPQDQDTIGYQFLSPEQRAKAREQFTAAGDELSKREPNAAIRAGEAIKSGAEAAFPVAPENEGIQTGVGRLIGGAAPAIAAGSAGGPAGVLASLAVIGSQAYDSAYHDAVANGASPEDAENAAGKSAVVQAATMVAPIGRLLQRVPMPLRDGLMKTLVNLGQNGVEFGSANALGTFANNYVAQQTYDPSRALTQGTGQAGLEGAIAGLVIPAAVGAVRTVRSAGEIATDVMKAPDIDGAIAAATREAGAAPGEIAAPAPAGDLFAPKPDAALAGQPDQTGAMTPLDWNRLFALRPEASVEGLNPAAPVTADNRRKPPETPATIGADPLYESVPKQPMRLAEWLRRPTTQFPGTAQETRIPGGIQDTGGDIEAILGGKNQRIGLINKSGRPQNEAAQAAWEAGYFPEFGPDQVPNESDLQDALRDDVNGVPRYSIHDDQDVSAYTRAVENNAEIGRLSANYDVDPKGMTRQQFYGAVRQKMTSEEFANEQQSLDTAHAESYAAMDRSARQDIPDSGLSAIYDQSQVRSVEDLEREYQQEIAATEARERAGATAPAGRERQDAASGQAGQGSDRNALGLAGRAATSGTGTDLATQAALGHVIPRTSAEAKAVASAYYKMADDVGGTLTPQFTDRFIDKAESLAPQTPEGQAVAGDTQLTELVDRLQGLRDKPISLHGAQEIDERLGDLIDKEYGLKGLSKEGYHLLDLQSTFRNMILDAGPEDTTNGTGGFQALKQGRAAWAQAMKMNDLERILGRAELTDNPATSIKSGLRVLLSNPTRLRGYSPEEIDALKDAANRGVLGGILHVFGSRLIPIGAGAVGMGTGPISAAVNAGIAYSGTAMARKAATALQSRRLGNAMSVLGEGVPPAPAPTPLAR